MMESGYNIVENKKTFRLLDITPLKISFIAENLDELEIEKVLNIDFVSQVIYNKKTKLLEIDHTNLPITELLKTIKSIIPGALFYENDNLLTQNNITPAATIIENFTQKGDDLIKNLFKGYADSQDLIFLFTSAMAAEELIRNPIMPKWYDWARMAQSAHSDIKTKVGMGVVEKEIKVSEQVSVDDFKKLIASVDELKSLIKKNMSGTK